ncbi:hypothetical protein AKJ09_02358 [Labilithrix luteola]|uniref:Uncharacterized protein n=1 Tax=Labilithrix luteola TaxID=1391654 RepID=A0A0K1PRF4_9BACT|nr:hypothetical protein [Labilithrix luteola]AKU95694.1 hypothetical protein AKJ09_02358 [Labilithrix luteola]
MTERDPSARDLLAPLDDAYAASARDRERIRNKLRGILGEAALPIAGAGAGAVGSRASRGTRPEARASVFTPMAGVLGVGVLVVVGAMVVRSFVGGSTRGDAPRDTHSTLPAPSAPHDDEPARPIDPPVDEAPERELSVPVGALPSAPSITKPLRTTTARDGDDPLEKETKLMREANRALGAGAYDKALELLDEHSRSFPRGFFVDERDVDRVLALCGLGQRTRATTEASVFVRTRSTSPLARRIATSCAGDVISQDAPRAGSNREGDER